MIFAGDPYYAEVWVIRGRIEVRRFHQNCPLPPYPEDLDEELEDYLDEEESEDDEEEYEWPLAA